MCIKKLQVGMSKNSHFKKTKHGNIFNITQGIVHSAQIPKYITATVCSIIMPRVRKCKNNNKSLCMDKCSMTQASGKGSLL